MHTEALPVVPMLVRGSLVADDLVTFDGRGGGISFRAPDPRHHAARLPLTDPGRMMDLLALRFDDVLDYLEELGERLDVTRNPLLAQALEASYATAPTTPPLMRASYAALPGLFRRSAVQEMAERLVGVDYLEGWVRSRLEDGREVGIRAFGARAVHVVAGNSPLLSAITIIRNAVVRGDAIIKSPSNDPFTALAIGRTMAEMAPDHPLTRHLSVAYWKGGDSAVEEQVYSPSAIEKIVAWGGLASITHIVRYIQPGIELVTLDPKRSMSIVGAEAFASDEAMADAAVRLATDIGAVNQEGCVNARTVYLLCGTDAAGIAQARRFGAAVHAAMLALPEHISTPPKHGIARPLRARIDALRIDPEWYDVIGGKDEEGAIIVSLLDEPVDFAPMLANRCANLVPVDTLDHIACKVDAFTQTVGVYPDALLETIADRFALHGAQRLVSLGYAAHGSFAIPQDATEPLRRMCRWVTREICEPDAIAPLWQTAGSPAA
ncbi:acyl-CoA reductase [Novosphingobium sp.]|uniref:acyl-CoA reductase n=1 Tax=Novosphingobium sp. TaxID=1874826 RepID=UPI003BACAC61